MASVSSQPVTTSQEQGQRKEEVGDYSANSGQSPLGGARPSRSTVQGATLHGESRPGSTRKRANVREQPARLMDSVPKVQAQTELCSPSRSPRTVPEGRSLGSGRGRSTRTFRRTRLPRSTVDKEIALAAAEQQLERIQSMRKGTQPKSRPKAAASKESVEPSASETQQPAISRHHSDQRQGDSRTPGRKAKKPNEVAEELEASAETFLGCMIPRTWTRTRKAMTGSGDNSFSVTFGLFAHGNMAGITRATDQLPNTCKYLNGCLKQWRPESKGDRPLVLYLPAALVVFSEDYHKTRAWKGNRWALTAFTARSLRGLEPRDRERLRSVGFPVLGAPPPMTAENLLHDDPNDEDPETEMALTADDREDILHPLAQAFEGLEEILLEYPASSQRDVLHVCDPWVEQDKCEPAMPEAELQATYAGFYEGCDLASHSGYVQAASPRYHEEDYLSVDGFDFKYRHQYHHFVLMVDEASGYAVVREAYVTPEDEGRDLTTDELINILEESWFQYFGYPKTLKMDLEGAHRGKRLREVCQDKGIELVVGPAEHHECIAAVGRSIGVPSLTTDNGRQQLERKTRKSPGDLVFYRRYRHPADLAANNNIDYPRMRIARWFGPARVLACETKVDGGNRRPSACIWAVAGGRLKKFHCTRLRHAFEQERLIAEATNIASMPWTFASLQKLMGKGVYDDESRPPRRYWAEGRKGRKRKPPRESDERIRERQPPEPSSAEPEHVRGADSGDEMVPDDERLHRKRERTAPVMEDGSEEELDLDRLLTDVQYMKVRTPSEREGRQMSGRKEDGARLRASVVSCSAAASACEKGSAWLQAMLLISSSQKSKIQLDVIAYSALASACAQGDSWQTAVCLVADLRQSDGHTDLVTCNAVITACAEGRRWRTATTMLRNFQKEQLRSDEVSVCAAITACQQEWPAAVHLLSLFRSGRSRVTFNAAAAAGEKGGCWQLALLFAKVGLQRLTPDAVSYNVAISACQKQELWQWAMLLLHELWDSRLRASVITYSVAIGAAHAAGRWAWALHFLQRLDRDGEAPNVITFNAVLSTCAGQHRWRRTLSLLSCCGPRDVVTHATAVAACELGLRYSDAASLLARLDSAGAFQPLFH
eukprot:s1768_g2.t1